MPKQTKKLLIYLDQNFLSNVAKSLEDDSIDGEYREIYSLLKQGFRDEKLVVPKSTLHRIESSMATHLVDKIAECQGCLGQVSMLRPDEVRSRQIDAALMFTLGNGAAPVLGIHTAFLDHPDQQVERFSIDVRGRLDIFDFRSRRISGAKQIEELRKRIIEQKISFNAQLEIEEVQARKEYLATLTTVFGTPLPMSFRKMEEFAKSSDFVKIPIISIETKLFAAILTWNPTRSITKSDAADIEMLSAYVPYMDVVCTDAFMGTLLRQLKIDTDFNVRVFSAKKSSLKELKTFLEDYLRAAPPARTPL